MIANVIICIYLLFYRFFLSHVNANYPFTQKLKVFTEEQRVVCVCHFLSAYPVPLLLIIHYNNNKINNKILKINHHNHNEAAFSVQVHFVGGIINLFTFLLFSFYSFKFE